MLRTFFRLQDDLHFEGRWYLNRLSDAAGIQLDSREFQYGRTVDVGPPMRAKTWKDGRLVEAQPPLEVLLDPNAARGDPLDFTFTNADMPVVVARVADIIAAIAPRDIQRIPVLVESRQEKYEIINVTCLIDCIDNNRSEIQWYAKKNKIRPDKAGKPEMITNLAIDPTRVGEHDIFRIDGWEVAIVVSSRVKCAFEDAAITGVRFQQVSP